MAPHLLFLARLTVAGPRGGVRGLQSGHRPIPGRESLSAAEGAVQLWQDADEAPAARLPALLGAHFREGQAEPHQALREIPVYDIMNRCPMYFSYVIAILLCFFGIKM